jgi:hypothetical protein
MDVKMWSLLLSEQNKLRIFEKEGYDRELVTEGYRA